MGERLIIVGGGGHGRAVAEAVRLSDRFEIAGFVDDAPHAREVCGAPMLGNTAALEAFLGVARIAIVAIGNNRLRERLQARAVAAGYEIATVIHPAAFVAPSARIGPGSTVMAGAIVGTESILGNGAIVNCGAVVDHHCVVENFAHVGTNASMAGGCKLGPCAWMQAGAALGYGVSLAADTVLAAGEARA